MANVVGLIIVFLSCPLETEGLVVLFCTAICFMSPLKRMDVARRWRCPRDFVSLSLPQHNHSNILCSKNDLFYVRTSSMARWWRPNSAVRPDKPNQIKWCFVCWDFTGKQLDVCMWLEKQVINLRQHFQCAFRVTITTRSFVSPDFHWRRSSTLWWLLTIFRHFPF